MTSTPRTLGSLTDSDLGTDIEVLAPRFVSGTLIAYSHGRFTVGTGHRPLTDITLSTDKGFTRTYESTMPFATEPHAIVSIGAGDLISVHIDGVPIVS